MSSDSHYDFSNEGFTEDDRLILSAVSAIAVARLRGKETHPVETWREESYEHQIRHAFDHVYECLTRTQEPWLPISEEDDLANAICRLTMAYFKREKEKYDAQNH